MRSERAEDSVRVRRAGHSFGRPLSFTVRSRDSHPMVRVLRFLRLSKTLCAFVKCSSVLLLAASSGCFVCPTHYRATGIVSTVNKPLPTLPSLPEVVATALSPYGLSGPVSEEHKPDVFHYSVGHQTLLSGFLISVTVDASARAVYVFDPAISPHTDFIREVQTAIQRQVSSAYGATIEFKPPPRPVHDCLGP